MSLFQEQMAFLRQVPRLIDKAFELGFDVTLGEGYRTAEQQEIYVKAGKSKTLNSNHRIKCAIDLNLLKNGVFLTREQVAPLGAYWESLDPKNRWGGNFKSFTDVPHFERNVA